MERRRQACYFTIVLLLGCFLRLYHLGYNSLWLDEAHKAFCALKPIGEILARAPENVDWSYHAILHYWIELFGRSEAALRSFSCLTGIAFLVLVYAAAGRLISRQARIPAMLLAALSPLHIYYSQEAAVYSLVMLASLVSLWSYYNALTSGSRLAWATYCGSSLVLIYALAHGIFIWAAQLAFFLISFGPKLPRLKSFLFVQTFLGLISLPKVLLILHQVRIDANPWIPPLRWMHPVKTFAYFALLGWHVPRLPYVKVGLAIGLPVIGILLVLGLWKGPGQRPLVRAHLIYPLLLLVATSLLKPNYVPGRYDVIFYPAFVLAVAAGFVAIRSLRWRAATAICVLGATLVCLHSYYFIYFKSNDRHWNQLLAREAAPDDVLVFTDLTIASFYYYVGQDRYPHALSLLPDYHRGWLGRRALAPDPQYAEMVTEDLVAKAYPLLSPTNRLFVIDDPCRLNEYLLARLQKDLELVEVIPIHPESNDNQVTAVHVFRLPRPETTAR